MALHAANRPAKCRHVLPFPSPRHVQQCNKFSEGFNILTSQMLQVVKWPLSFRCESFFAAPFWGWIEKEAKKRHYPLIWHPNFETKPLSEPFTRSPVQPEATAPKDLAASVWRFSTSCRCLIIFCLGSAASRETGECLREAGRNPTGTDCARWPGANRACNLAWQHAQNCGLLRHALAWRVGQQNAAILARAKHSLRRTQQRDRDNLPCSHLRDRLKKAWASI